MLQSISDGRQIGRMVALFVGSVAVWPPWSCKSVLLAAGTTARFFASERCQQHGARAIISSTRGAALVAAFEVAAPE